jgi:hypothetical protein
MEAAMHIGDLGPIELGMIAVGVLVLAGVIYWRIRLSRIPKETEEHLKPE